MAHSPEEIKKSLKFYWMIGGALTILTVLTWAVHMVHIPFPWDWTVGMLIAVFKAGLVGAVFMHMVGEKPMINRMMIFACFFAAALMLLCVLAYVDHVPQLF